MYLKLYTYSKLPDGTISDVTISDVTISDVTISDVYLEWLTLTSHVFFKGTLIFFPSSSN